MPISRQLDRHVRLELMFEAVSGSYPKLSRKVRRAISKTRLKNIKAGIKIPPLPPKAMRPTGKDGRLVSTETYRRGFDATHTPGPELFKMSGSRKCQCGRTISANKSSCARCMVK